MGVIRTIFRSLFQRGMVTEISRAGVEIAEVFRPNATRQLELGHQAYSAAQASHAAEFRYARRGWFDALVNGINRLPRPALALGTLALFAYAMQDPVGFGVRMQGLAQVPEPLWWLLGAIVAFYFGARETHHLRHHRRVAPAVSPSREVPRDPVPANAAIVDWVNLAQDDNVGRD